LSHAFAEGPYAGRVKVREPVDRPLDVVAAELLLTASQAFLVGLLTWLAAGVWEERLVGAGPTLVILALMGLGVGAAWLFWLLGGVGWPLTLADAPVVLFLVFDLALGFAGQELLALEPLVMLMALAAAGYGMVAGIFLEPPRRWRWDQRQRPRAGTPVPRVSDTTKTLARRVPRSIRPSAGAAGAGPGTTGRRGRAGASAAPLRGTVAADAADTEADDRAPAERSGARWADEDDDLTAVFPEPEVGPAAERRSAGTPATESAPPTDTTDTSVATAGAAREADADAGAATAPVDLPTSVEPRAQKSPWAWAAPPEWNREEDDEPPRRTSGRP
jgi:hypothetical protein